MMRNLIALLIAVSLVAAACGGGSDDPIDAAENCTALEAAVDVIIQPFVEADNQDGWQTEELPRATQRYDDLGCSFVLRTFINISDEL